MPGGIGAPLFGVRVSECVMVSTGWLKEPRNDSPCKEREPLPCFPRVLGVEKRGHQTAPVQFSVPLEITERTLWVVTY